MVLRKELFWSREMKDDKVIEPFFEIGITHTEDDWGLQARQRGGEGGAYVWEPALHDESEIEQLHPPRFAVDEETTAATVALAREIFGDLLEIRRAGVWWWSLGLTLDLSLWRGLEGIMMDMIERPQVIHRLMGLLRDGTLQKLDRLQEQGLLGLNSEQYVGSGGFGYTRQLPSGSAAGAGSHRRRCGVSARARRRWAYLPPCSPSSSSPISCRCSNASG